MSRGDSARGPQRKPRHPAGTIALGILAQQGTRGASAAQLAELRGGVSLHSTYALLDRLVRDGLVVWRDWRYHLRRYYLAQHGPDLPHNAAACAAAAAEAAAAVGTERRVNALRVREPAAQAAAATKARRLDPAAPAVVPPGLKVTVCPSGVDQRFTFHPPSRHWRGEITRDWQQRRLAERQQGGRHAAQRQTP